MSNELSEEILAIWFPEFDENECVPAKYQQRWWVRDTSFDAMLTQKFQSHVVLAGQGKYDDWLTTSRSGLALIILMFMFRNFKNIKPVILLIFCAGYAR